MKKLLIPFFITLFIAAASPVFSAPLTITQNFGFVPDGAPPAGAYMNIDENTGGEEINPRRDQGEDFDITPTGFSWGGYASDTGYRVEIDENSRGDVTFQELIFKASSTLGTNVTDSYAYTIMSSNGDNVPDTFIDLTGVDAAIHFKISDIWHGWFGGGDNGSGLPEPCNEVRATVLRVMIRDAKGDWFMSDLFCPSTLEVPVDQGGDTANDGNIIEYTLYMEDTSWRKLSYTESANLNLLQGDDEIPLQRDPGITDAPDLSAVSGFGVYVWNVYDQIGGQLAFTEISLIGDDSVPPAEPDYVTVAQNFDKYGDVYHVIDGLKGNPLAPVPEEPQVATYETTYTNWAWGGYCTDSAFTIELDQNDRGGATFEELVFKVHAIEGENITDSYAYTIMSASGGNIPTTTVDMTGSEAAINFKISDIWSGWFGGGDNGSGLPAPQNEVRATVLRAMIRDANGDWFMSNLFCPSTVETGAGDLDGTIVEYTFDFAGALWHKLRQFEIDNLNALAGGDEIPLDRDPNVTNGPDLSAVGGFGVYVWNAYELQGGQLAFTEISLKGFEPTVYRLTQNFDKSADEFYGIDSPGTDEIVRRPDFTTTTTGWSWGGYADAGVFYVEIDRNNTTAFDELVFKNSSSTYGSYAYTIFDSSGGNQPDGYIDMSTEKAGIELKMSDVWHGWLGGGDNGSGLPRLAGENRVMILRAMIRDAESRWYASEIFCPIAVEAPGNSDGYFTGQILESSYPLSETTWYQYDTEQSANLNALANGDEIELPRDPNVAVIEPNLFEVTGMGIYIWNQYNTSSGTFAIKEMSLLGEQPVIPPVYWDIDELQALAPEWLKDSVSWQENMDTDPAESDDWQLRNGTSGDYIISGGQMVILGNTDNWRLDTAPSQLFSGTTTASASMQATTVSADQTPVNRTGINLWLKGDIDETDGTLETNVNVVLEGDNTQYVEFISGWTGGTWPPSSFVKVEGDGITDFDTSMLDIYVAIEPNLPPLTTGLVSYEISDQSGTTATGRFTVERRTTENTASIHTVYSGGAQGIVDDVMIESGYYSPYDRAGNDGIIDYLDFEWLGNLWMTERTDPWP